MEAQPETQENAEQEVYEEITQEEQEIQQEDYIPIEEPKEQKPMEAKQENPRLNNSNRSNFIHGLSVGLGIGCIATFVIVWVTVFFTPQLPTAITYESLLAIFIYPLIYLLAVGLIALTAGIVREYYSVKNKL